MKKALRLVRTSYRHPHVQWYTVSAGLWAALAIQIGMMAGLLR